MDRPCVVAWGTRIHVVPRPLRVVSRRIDGEGDDVMIRSWNDHAVPAYHSQSLHAFRVGPRTGECTRCRAVCEVHTYAWWCPGRNELEDSCISPEMGSRWWCPPCADTFFDFLEANVILGGLTT